MGTIRCRLIDTPGFSDIELPISYFSIQAGMDGSLTLAVSVASTDQAANIAVRGAGILVLAITRGQIETELARAPLSTIRMDEGGMSKAITLQAISTG